jgi:peptide/nickel transport system substrate-binding protein
MAAGAVVAAAGLTALTACSSGGSAKTTLSGIGASGLYGSIPAASSGTQHAGTIKVAMLNGWTPWILPTVVPAADYAIYTTSEFDYMMWRTLYWFPNGTSQTEDKQLSLANDPVWSNGGKTATIKLKGTYKWSDGQQVTSKDVQFAYDEMAAAAKESPANLPAYTPGVGIPDQVASVTTPDDSTVVFNLKSPINPTFFFQSQLAQIQPMPSHAWAKASANGPVLDYTNPANAKKIYDFLSAQSKSVATYATNPLWQIVDGPYKLTSFNTTSNDWSMSPNTAYSGPTAKVVSPVQTTFYASSQAAFNALKSGAATVGYVPMADVPQASSLKSNYNVFGYPSLGFHAIFYNFKDTTGNFDKIIGQLYIRQALAQLNSQQGIIKAVYHGAGAPQAGVLGQYPASQYTPANSKNNPYPYSPTNAVNLLKSHGWNVVPNGTTTCAKPGTAANECGAGIPAGAKLAWNLPYAAENSTSVQMATAFASQVKAAGINITLKSDSFQNIISNDNDVSAPKNADKWAMELFGGENFTNPYVTTFGLFNSTGSGNLGGYSDPQADKVINASVTGSDPNALKNELTYLTEQQPVLFEPAEDYATAGGLMAISKQVSGDPSSFSAYTQNMLLPEFWYFTK